MNKSKTDFHKNIIKYRLIKLKILFHVILVENLPLWYLARYALLCFLH